VIAVGFVPPAALPETVVTLSLSNLRGPSSEPIDMVFNILATHYN
jgi:hypothetical protein